MAQGTQGAGMKPALAIFVKTPGFSPVKTRLAVALGTVAATQFHQLAAAATAAVVRVSQPHLTPYWAVAEVDPAAGAAWSGFAQLWQGEGDLGERLHRVYAQLQARHGRALLIGADAPQLTPAVLRGALAVLDDADTPFVLGEAADGGFWLVGGRAPIARSVWLGVSYSQTDTATQLRATLTPFGNIAVLPILTDVDDAADLPALVQALDALPDPLPAQRALRDWLHGASGRSSVRVMHA